MNIAIMPSQAIDDEWKSLLNFQPDSPGITPIHTTASKMSQYLPPENNYDESRLKKKLSSWVVVLFILKSMAGVVFFTSQFNYGLCGYILGSLS